MRVLGTFVLTVTLAILLAATGESQQPRPIGGPGQGINPLALIGNPAVQKELGLSEEQLKKLPEAVQKALAEVLDAKQAKRLQQIQLQQRGVQAFTDATVAKQLKISDSQQEKIKGILEGSRKEMAELFKGGGGREAFQKMASMRKETQEKVESVLSDEQKKAYKDLVGEEFKMGFGRFGGGGGDQPKGGFRKKGGKKAAD